MEKWTKIKSDHHWRRGNVVAKLPAWLWVRTLCCSESSCTVYSTTLHRASNGKKEWWNRLDRMQHTIILFTFNCGKNFIRQFVFSSLLVCVCVWIGNTMEFSRKREIHFLVHTTQHISCHWNLMVEKLMEEIGFGSFGWKICWYAFDLLNWAAFLWDDLACVVWWKTKWM